MKVYNRHNASTMAVAGLLLLLGAAPGKTKDDHTPARRLSLGGRGLEDIALEEKTVMKLLIAKMSIVEDLKLQAMEGVTDPPTLAPTEPPTEPPGGGGEVENASDPEDKYCSYWRCRCRYRWIGNCCRYWRSWRCWHWPYWYWRWWWWYPYWPRWPWWAWPPYPWPPWPWPYWPYRRYYYWPYYRRIWYFGGGGKPDPHLMTWQGSTFDYHGICDLVLVKSDYIDIHARAEDFGGWSGFTSTAFRIKDDDAVDDLFEIQVDASDELRTLYQGNDLAEPEHSSLADDLANKYNLTMDANVVSLMLPGMQYLFVAIDSAFPGSLMVTVPTPQPSFFGDAVGLLGTFADVNGTGMLGRDGSNLGTDENPDANAFGEEWRVDVGKGDPLLFQTPGAETCTYTRRSLAESSVNASDAQDACDNAAMVTLKQWCTFDAVLTEDLSIAQTDFYTIPANDTEVLALKTFFERGQCIPPESDTSNECERLGGTCVWRCNESNNDCDTALCTAVDGFDEFSTVKLKENEVNGCACAFEKGIRLTTEMCAKEGGTCIENCTPDDDHECDASLCGGSSACRHPKEKKECTNHWLICWFKSILCDLFGFFCLY